ncbi:non-homologous end-joining DNA ligase [Candidatus Babeliales bacterium]|nr:non-homologous end-joining DNA ligase [Candidatus Babeliales bacterium]
MKIGRYLVNVSNPEKIWFPQSKITKVDLVAYYRDIAPFMLPFTKDRALTLHRFPDGIDHEGFYQKNIGAHFPAWVASKKIKNKEAGYTTYVVCNNAASLAYIATQGCITPHLWLSKIDKLNYPDRMIFDLDPFDDDFTLVCWTAKELKKELEERGLTPFVMTTGSRGLHVVVPLKRTATFDVVRDYARDIATLLVQRYPKKLTINPRKESRGRKLLIDCMRNAYGATAVTPYAVRAIEKAPVAMPIFWEELARTTPQRFTIKTIFKRLLQKEDPWQKLNKAALVLKPLPYEKDLKS